MNPDAFDTSHLGAENRAQVEAWTDEQIGILVDLERLPGNAPQRAHLRDRADELARKINAAMGWAEASPEPAPPPAAVRRRPRLWGEPVPHLGKGRRRRRRA